MNYIPVKDPAAAKELSERLYKLSRPNPDPEDVTTSLIGWVIHPDTGAVMAALPDGLDIPIAISSDPKTLSALLTPFVAAGSITTADVTSIETKLTISKGSRVPLLDILPAFWIERQQTYEQLKADGWFASAVAEPAENPSIAILAK